MRTADEIRNADFAKTPFGGYRQADVEIFLEDIAEDVQKLQSENVELTRKCADLQSKIEDFQGSETSLQSILMSAQRLADSIVAEAKATAEKVLEKTGEQATEILSEANSTAEALKTKVEAEATRILGEAVQKSNLIISGAEEKVKNQTALLDTYKAETTAFKKDIIDRYKAQLELILALPEIAVNVAEAPVAEETAVAEEIAEEVVEDEIVEDIPVRYIEEEDTIIFGNINDEEEDADDGEEGFVIVDDEEEEDF